MTRRAARESLAGAYVVKPRIVEAYRDSRRFECRATTVWYEWRYKDRCILEPAIITCENALLTQDMIAEPSVLDWANYNVNWRLWTHKPSEELRKEVAWCA